MDLISKVLHIAKGEPRCAILMSGNGSNADAVLRNSKMYMGMKFHTIITDKPTSNAHKLATKYGLRCILARGSVKSEKERMIFFKEVALELLNEGIDFIVYAGFMKVATAEFTEKLPGINIHPADLSIFGFDGKPKYRGMPAIVNAIHSGEKEISSTVHVVEPEFDCGFPIAISEPININGLENRVDVVHYRLKYEREHILYPTILHLLNSSRISVEDLPLRGYSSTLVSCNGIKQFNMLGVDYDQ